jgi:hypothetical protein
MTVLEYQKLCREAWGRRPRFLTLKLGFNDTKTFMDGNRIFICPELEYKAWCGRCKDRFICFTTGEVTCAWVCENCVGHLYEESNRFEEEIMTQIV